MNDEIRKPRRTFTKLNLKLENLVKSKVIQEQILLDIKTQIEEANKTIQQIRLNEIEKSAERYPEIQQVCTCDNPREGIISCRRHLCRYFKNKGCIWCAETDCGKFSC